MNHLRLEIDASVMKDKMALQTKDYDEMVEALELSGDFRVLRRLKQRSKVAEHDGTPVFHGALLDVETTGLDIENSEVIELAILPFEFSSDGRIFNVGNPLQQFNEPTTSLPSEITALTGLTDEMLAGQRLDISAIDDLVRDVNLIVAHNAAFDRPFAEKTSNVFVEKPWACSMTGVSWKDEGIDGRRLADLLARFGFFFDAHRASEDCQAALELLTQTLPRTDKLVLQAILEGARQNSFVISAIGAPFEAKDTLKRRRYKWDPGGDGHPKAWCIEVTELQLQNELKFLEEQVFRTSIDLPVKRITAFNRFSGRP